MTNFFQSTNPFVQTIDEPWARFNLSQCFVQAKCLVIFTNLCNCLRTPIEYVPYLFYFFNFLGRIKYTLRKSYTCKKSTKYLQPSFIAAMNVIDLLKSFV